MRAEGEAAVTSVAILRQLDTLLGVVSDSLDKSQEAVGKPCREVLGRLTRMTMLSPYFRSLVLVERENVYCSSCGASCTICRCRWPSRLWAACRPGSASPPATRRRRYRSGLRSSCRVAMKTDPACWR
ncbi:CSS-motif domain-containing protein [Pseudomonas aeruginosa]|nr:CSS-motif domain-containing protein [Pseudomonas aeruginosa]MDF5952780.1 CSS-motif domain-containing protein [Pseudomonas aeruginosa]